MAELRRDDRLVVATHNAGKVREFADLLKPYGIAAASAAELGLPEPEETGTTFAENAKLKAVAAAEGAGLPALADDSGLAVDILNGLPGIFSARWAGSDKDFDRAMRNVEEELHHHGAISPDDRQAQFVCALCLAWPNGETTEVYGEVAGTLIWPPRGANGFGYDPMFMPEGHQRTFGEMSAADKHGGVGAGSLSHRARAFALFAAQCLSQID